MSALLCRVAEDVFWMSRYVERVLAVGQLLDVVDHLEGDAVDDPIGRAELWAPLLAARPNEEVPRLTAIAADPEAVRHWLAFDRSNPRSIVCCVQRARTAARGVREHISGDMWEALNALWLATTDPALERTTDGDTPVFPRRAREAALYIQGLGDVTLAHEECWHFVRLGKFLERADDVAHALGLQAHLLRDRGRDEEDVVRWLAVLHSCGSAEAYARYYSLRVEPARVIEFLLLNPRFPRTVRFSLHEASEALEALGGDALATTPATRALGRLAAQLEHATVDEILERGLQSYLSTLQRDIAEVADQITRTYLRGEPPPRRVAPVARAARLLAEQQEQQQQQ